MEDFDTLDRIIELEHARGKGSRYWWLQVCLAAYSKLIILPGTVGTDYLGVLCSKPGFKSSRIWNTAHASLRWVVLSRSFGALICGVRAHASLQLAAYAYSRRAHFGGIRRFQATTSLVCTASILGLTILDASAAQLPTANFNSFLGQDSR
jgi:hypothetical protein